jgi:tRNA uridine 5-carboxymethylaminomethyl modification enzyme
MKATRTAGLSVWQRLQRSDDPAAADWRLHPEVAAMELSEEVIEAIMIEAKYEGYMGRQERQIEDFRNLENIRLPEGLDYTVVPHLRFEAREKLSTHRPHNLGQAGRIGGITPADLMVLQIHLKKWYEQRAGEAGKDEQGEKIKH